MILFKVGAGIVSLATRHHQLALTLANILYSKLAT